MTNPMTMVERVADALSTVTTGPNAGDLVISQIFSDELWAIMSDRLARAAIAAMREPNRQMADAAYERQRGLNCAVQNGLNYSAIYETMIDAALFEHKTQTRKG